MKKIKLTQGKIALVDDELFKELNKHKWCAVKGGNTYYAVRRESGVIVYIHRQILNLNSGDGKIVDHTNHNGLDNRRKNLRIVSHTKNCRNHRGCLLNTSGYTGVHWNKRTKKWSTQIKANYKTVYLGEFNNINDAIDARKQGEIKYWGETRS